MTMSNGEKMLWAVAFNSEMRSAEIETSDDVADYVQRAVEEATGMVQLMRESLPAVASVFEPDSDEIMMLREMLGRSESVQVPIFPGYQTNDRVTVRGDSEWKGQTGCILGFEVVNDREHILVYCGATGIASLPPADVVVTERP